MVEEENKDGVHYQDEEQKILVERDPKRATRESKIGGGLSSVAGGGSKSPTKSSSKRGGAFQTYSSKSPDNKKSKSPAKKSKSPVFQRIQNMFGRKPSRIGVGTVVPPPSSTTASIPTGVSPSRNNGNKNNNDSSGMMFSNNHNSNFKSGIGSGTANSPSNKSKSQKNRAMFLAKGSSVPAGQNFSGLSPVKDENIKDKQKRDELDEFLESTKPFRVSYDDEQMKSIRSAAIKAAKEDKAIKNAKEAPAFDFGFVENEQQIELGDQKDYIDGQPDNSNSKECTVDEPVEDDTEEESSLQNLPQISQNQAIIYQDEIEQVGVDLLRLARTVKRTAKVDLIAEMQRQIDAIDASIQVNDDGNDEGIQREIQIIEDRMSNFKQYRPDIIEEFDQQMKKLDHSDEVAPVANLIVAEQSDGPFMQGYRRVSCAFNLDDGQADKLRLELEKLQNDNERIDEESSGSGSESDDFLAASLKRTDVVRGEENLPESMIEGGEILEDDSRSYMLPIPPQPAVSNDESSLLSATNAQAVDDDGIMDDDQTQQYMKGRLQEKLAQLNEGGLETLTECPDQEDMMSQIGAVENNLAQSKRVSNRNSFQVQGIPSLKQGQKKDRSQTMFNGDGFSQSQLLQTYQPNTESLLVQKGGFESLAKKNLQRPRSFDARDEGDLFDTESEVFSAFKSESESSAVNEEEKVEDNLDFNIIEMTANNTDFQRLVTEAKAEKEKINGPKLTIMTEDGKQEDQIGLVLPKVLPKPQNPQEQEQQTKDLREIVTYRSKQEDIAEKEFKDSAPKATNLLISGATLEPSISMTSLLSLLITDSSLVKARTAHLYLCEDRELTKSKIGLKILYEQLMEQSQVEQAAMVLLKISKVFFCLNQMAQANETVSKAIQHFQTDDQQEAPLEFFFWQGMILSYLIFTKRSQAGQRKIAPQRQQAAQRDLSQMINTCELALIKVSPYQNFKIPAKFLLLKLALLVQREKFGCDLQYVTQIQDVKMAKAIGRDDPYYGQIAKAEVYVDGQDKSPKKALKILKDVIAQNPKRGEAYIKLWQLNMYCGNLLRRSQSQQQLQDERDHNLVSSIIEEGTNPQNSYRSFSNKFSVNESEEDMSFDDSESALDQSRRSQSIATGNADKAKRYYAEAYEVVSQLILNCDENFTSSPQQKLLLVFLSVKSLQKSGQYIQAFELLQREFAENPSITSLMYLYGKYVVKAMANEVHEQLSMFMMAMHGHQQQIEQVNKFSKKQKKGKDFRIDQGYLGSGIGALEECLRACFNERHAKVNYYIGFAYKILRMPLKTQEYWVKAFNLNKQQKKLSTQQSQQVSMFLKEQSFITIIAENSDQMIKERQGLRKPVQGAPKLTDQMLKNQIKEYMTSMEKMGKIDKPNSLLFQARMESYLIETENSENFGQAFATLIEQYPTFIDSYINYWHYLKYRLTTLSSQGGQSKHAKQIKDKSGINLLDKMRECATNALMRSGATEVPTGLWVEARIVYAKQMIFEKQIGQAISILKDICQIIPPYPIDGLSYVSYMDNDDAADLLSLSPRATQQSNRLTADEAFMRQANLMKARNSPTRSRINRDAPLFQKKTFGQSMFGGFKKSHKSQQVLPKGPIDIKKLQSNLDDESKNDDDQSSDSPKYSKKASQLEQPIDNSIFNQIQNLEIINEEGMMPHAPQKKVKQPRSNTMYTPYQQQDIKLSNLNNNQQQVQMSPRASTKRQKGGMMYRKQPQQLLRQSNQDGTSGMNSTGGSHKKNKTLTIYNPFNFNQDVIMNQSVDQSAILSGSGDQDEQPLRQKKTISALSQSYDFSQKSSGAMAEQIEGEQQAPDEDGQPLDQLELAYQAMLKAQTLWQQRQEETEQKSERQSCQISEQESVTESRQGAIIESENFAIYSNFKFLQLIGKYCAKSKQYSDEGLKALNDYLLLLDYNRSNVTKIEYESERAITIFYIGIIYYQMKDTYHAYEHLVPIQAQLHAGKFYKELAQSELIVSRIWTTYFNDQTIHSNYFSKEILGVGGQNRQVNRKSKKKVDPPAQGQVKKKRFSIF